jgi:hypothetical protein
MSERHELSGANEEFITDFTTEARRWESRPGRFAREVAQSWRDARWKMFDGQNNPPPWQTSDGRWIGRRSE